MPPLVGLKRRADFLAASRARRASRPGLTLQARRRTETDRADAACVRVGFTCSRKVGNAVARNRAKRRLREVARDILSRAGRPGWDYVLIGRPTATAGRPFADLTADLAAALARVHAPDRRDPGEAGSMPGPKQSGAPHTGGPQARAPGKAGAS